MLNIKFDHTKSKLKESFGLSPDDMKLLGDIMIFEIINLQYQASLLYDNMNDVPTNLKSVSSIIENCLKRCTSVEMAAYLLYVLEETKNKIYETLDLAEKADIKNLSNNKLSGDDILSMLSNVTRLLSVQKLIHDVIEANGSFEKFRKIKTKNNSDFSDIDELINKALKNKDDE